MAKKAQTAKDKEPIKAPLMPPSAPQQITPQQIMLQPNGMPTSFASDGAPLIPIQAPSFHATTVLLQALSTDVTIVFQRAAPVFHGYQGVSQQTAVQQPVAIIQMSAHALKDFSIVVTEVVAKLEKEFGVLETEFTKRRAAEAKAAKAKAETTGKPASSRRH